jgi:hypothetical protein
METNEIIVRNQQSLEDLAVEHYGTVEGVMNLLLDNRDQLSEGFSSSLYAGMVLRVRPEPINEDMREAVRKLGIHPVSDEDTGLYSPSTGDYNDDYNSDYTINE